MAEEKKHDEAVAPGPDKSHDTRPGTNQPQVFPCPVSPQKAREISDISSGLSDGDCDIDFAFAAEYARNHIKFDNAGGLAIK